MGILGVTMSDVLMLVTLALILISIVSIFRRNGNGNGSGSRNGNGSVAADTERMSAAWQMLTQEQRREIEIWRELAGLRGDQLADAHVEPATMAQAETIYSTVKDISEEFSIDELDTLMLAINIKPDTISGDTIDERARELVLAADRRGKLAALVRAVRKERP